VRLALALLLLAPAFGLAAERSEQPDSEVRLRAETSCTGAMVLLGDIAAVRGPGERADRLYAVKVGRAPLPGKERSYTLAEVRSAVAAAGLDTEGISFTGEPRVRVWAEAQTIESEPLVAAARQALEELASQQDGVEVELDFPNLPAPALIRPGEYKLSVELPPDALQPGPRTLHVRLVRGDERLADVSISARVRVFRTVVVAARRIETNDVVEARDLRRERREITGTSGDGLTDPARILGQRARQPVAQGKTLDERLFEPAPVIRKGDRVLVNVTRGSLTIRAEAQALSDAPNGQNVRLKLIDNNAEVLARASGPGQADL